MGLQLETVKGGTLIDLLWTNPKSDSAFPKQTVSLELSMYDAVMVTAISWIGTNNLLGPVIVPVGENGLILPYNAINNRVVTVAENGVSLR